MTVQFVDSHFVESYYPTIEKCPINRYRLVIQISSCIYGSTFNKKIKLRGQDFSLDIHDTAGQVRQGPVMLFTRAKWVCGEQDEFSILQSKQAVGLHGWILVYSVTSRSSFEMVSIIRDKVLNYTGIDSVPVVIVGNKSDLDAQRCVDRYSQSISLDR